MKKLISSIIVSMLFLLGLFGCQVNNILLPQATNTPTSTNTIISTFTPTVTNTATITPTYTGGGGGKIIFGMRDTNGYSAINTIYSDGSGMKTILSSSQELIRIGDPSYSPDGKNIIYVETKIAANYASDTSKILIANSDGTKGRAIVNTDSSNFSPEWSPDGSMIGYISNINDPGPFSRGEQFAYFEVFIKYLNQEKIIELKNSVTTFELAWAPDNQKIVIATDTNENGSVRLRLISCLRIIDLNTLKKVELTCSMGTYVETSNPSWSPDGTLIAFNLCHINKDEYAWYPDDCDIYTINPKTKDIQQIKNEYSWKEDPVWSPDGTKIAFITTKDHNSYDLCIMNSDGSDTKCIVRNLSIAGIGWEP